MCVGSDFICGNGPLADDRLTRSLSEPISLFVSVVLEGLESDAREPKKGLWADLQPVPTWEWRKRR
jgi:hypothetical protein